MSLMETIPMLSPSNFMHSLKNFIWDSTVIESWHVVRTWFIIVFLAAAVLVQAFALIRRCSSLPALKPFAQNKLLIEPEITSNVAQSSPFSKDEAVIVTHKISSKRSSGPKRIVGMKKTRQASGSVIGTVSPFDLQPVIFFSSLSGSTEKAAVRLSNSLWQSLQNSPLKHECTACMPQLVDLSDCEYDEYFVTLPKKHDATADFIRPIKYLYLILIPTYNIDTYLDNFLEYLRDIHYDFRVDTAPLSAILGYAVFGFGDRQGWPTEETGFCSQAIQVDKWLAKLTGKKRAYPLGMGDVQDATEKLLAWSHGIEQVIRDFTENRSLGQGVEGSGDANESDEELETASADAVVQAKLSSAQRRNTKDTLKKLDDLEDLSQLMRGTNDDSSQPLPIDFTTSGLRAASTIPIIKEMVPKSSPTYNALTKQGYTIVGSHSGVKICRWTKSALRGRGSCYKFSFYGIKSHLCMETTPSLSCSNKCVFCWRHGTNPVGTTWRWQVDPPEMIFEGVKEGHYKKIKMMRGVPGIRAERFEEAMRIRHCALSLVGEPIFYPHINEFTALLHAERISSFLVCNAQHPQQLAALKPVTQLYVSIDASNRDSLRKIDRPLHRDFWERFCKCLDIIREKQFCQRTVFRLTLVKGFNIEDEAEGYADLVARGLPCFVEIKGVTYCGTSSSAGAGLTMQNVPFYEEVCEFVEALNAALQRRSLGYGIAAEHAHSCCILLASNRFLIEGRWHTVIDYEQFFKCLESGNEFTPEDYVAPTPTWALWGNGGFDPADVRVDRKGRKRIE